MNDERPPCPKKCGAEWQLYAGKFNVGWALIHKPGCTALAPTPKPTLVDGGRRPPHRSPETQR